MVYDNFPPLMRTKLLQSYVNVWRTVARRWLTFGFVPFEFLYTNRQLRANAENPELQ